MGIVLQLARELTECPTVAGVEGVRLRTFGAEGDVERWLELRHRAFARLRIGVRNWSAGDFAAEFLDKGWWRPERLWFAETTPCKSGEEARAVGAVTLALRGEGPAALPAVHWLAVLPEWRRRGVGRLLMAQLERAAWEAGYRRVVLETHAGWTAAARFYAALGYRQPQL